MSEQATEVVLEAGAELPGLTVTPDRFTPVRYAGASGDFNPIHVDDEFARQVGLPGRILHGLWSMAQVARATTEAARAAGLAGPDALVSLSVQFRGLAVPDEEIVVTGKVDEVVERDGVRTAVVAATAKQGSTRIVRNGRAELRLDPPAAVDRPAGG
ncbi:MaoC/PaaZ C-terminal domain-containing protein [Patulibacter brassicae]|uniref:MaoC/PaaZ C-terminal domain-containing protein n=1 Tax=Patulibacter brassicae TaxID=1705717 RepID=A0ABU4VFM5_9ACTN|nr:MaoC/PaaZ C-terminal domain-containing protein [Patulibacter brassicae]MDX8150626.1 MaoC/PaaZ C-terminal domain-containing protein [Patulibacter brassicae]